jgi:hypothetical protein
VALALMDWQHWLAEQSTRAPGNGYGLIKPSSPPPLRPAERQAADLLVRTINPEHLARTLAQLPMSSTTVLVETWDGDSVTVRCFNGCAGFVRFAIDRQGYGTVLG